MLYQIVVIDLDNYIQVTSHADELIINNLFVKNNDMYMNGSADNANLIIQKNINNKTKFKYPTNQHLIPHSYYINNNIPTNSVHYRFFLVGKYERNIRPDEYSYLDLIKDLIYTGDYRKTRNGFTYSLFGKNLEFDIKDKFPLLTTKKVFFRGIIEELLFFLDGKTDSKILEAKGVNIWKPNTTPEFIKSRNLNYQEGDMGPMYGFNWIHFGAKYNGCNSSYKNCGLNQLEQVIKLLRDDPMSRRILMTTYNPAVAEEGVLYPCHGIVVQFYVNKKEDINYVSCSMTQRSADIALGVPYNIASYAALVYILCKHLGDKYKPDKLIINFGDVHLYEEHIKEALIQIDRDPLVFPKLEINDFKDLSELTFEHFTLKDYKSHPSLKFEMKA